MRRFFTTELDGVQARFAGLFEALAGASAEDSKLEALINHDSTELVEVGLH